MRPNCYIDFDGTIVSNKKRLYQFFLDHIPDQFKNCLTEDEFWLLKRMQINEIDWLNNVFKIEIDRNTYDAQKINEIESETYLQLDYLIDPSKEALRKIGEKYNVVLVSRRTNADALRKEINELEITKYLDKIIIVPHDNSTKSEHIRRALQVHDGDILIGDTEDDIACGMKLGIVTYFVKTGIRSEWIVKKFQYSRIKIVDSIVNIL